MLNVSVIIVGNEILSGRTLDQNSNFIAKRCTKLGLKLNEVRVIPDVKTIIKKTVIKASKNQKYVFVTGGIGPTHDDITALSIAEAFKRKLVLNKVARELLIKYYKKSNIELNKSRMKMAYIPARAKLIMNPVSGAPGFKVKNVWVMAGVPKIMQAMFIESVEPLLQKGKVIVSKSIEINKPEGDIAEVLDKIDNEYPSLEIGSYPFYKPPKIGTNIVFRSTNSQIINKGIKKFINILESKGILFSVD